MIGVLAATWVATNAAGGISCAPGFRGMASVLRHNPNLVVDRATADRPWDVYRLPADQTWPEVEVRVSHPGASAHPAIIRRRIDHDAAGEHRMVAVCCWADRLSCSRLAEDQGLATQLHRSAR